MAKPCPVTDEQFAEKAQPVQVIIAGQTFTVYPKEVRDGKSLGWFLNGKMSVMVDGVMVPCQIGLNLTCIGSK